METNPPDLYTSNVSCYLDPVDGTLVKCSNASAEIAERTSGVRVVEDSENSDGRVFFSDDELRYTSYVLNRLELDDSTGRGSRAPESSVVSSRVLLVNFAEDVFPSTYAYVSSRADDGYTGLVNSYLLRRENEAVEIENLRRKIATKRGVSYTFVYAYGERAIGDTKREFDDANVTYEVAPFMETVDEFIGYLQTLCCRRCGSVENN